MKITEKLRSRRIAYRTQVLYSRARLFSSRFDHPIIQEIPIGKRILVLCPHPDDDVIGAGGALRKHIEAGSQVAVLVLTDGSAGDSSKSRQQIASIRRQEQLEAAAVLGIKQIHFWIIPDGALTAAEGSATNLRELITDLQPDLVYLPSFLDKHPDHRAVTPLLAKSLEKTNLDFTCVVYELNVPILPNVVVDISEQIEIKLKALAAHKSQLDQVNYAELVKSFARWRAVSLTNSAAYAESFFVENVHSYLNLWQRVIGKD